MTLDALIFVVRPHEPGRLLTAVGLVCLDPRYGAVLPQGWPQPRRLFAPAKEWEAIAQELSLGLAPGPLPASSRSSAS